MEYYTLLDARDAAFMIKGTVEAIAEYLDYDASDIYDIDDQLKRDNDGLAGYYIAELV